jgi:hypothetical protein
VARFRQVQACHQLTEGGGAERVPEWTWSALRVNFLPKSSVPGRQKYNLAIEFREVRGDMVSPSQVILQWRITHMPLPMPVSDRESIHARTMSFVGFRRQDGLWDVDGHMTDIRQHDVLLKSGPRAAGEPIHDMWIRLTFDVTGTIQDVLASTDAVPFPGSCGNITPTYANLVGKKVGAGFSKEVRSMFGGIRGCTHLTELLLAMATVVIQTLVGETQQLETERPFSLDGCHALNTNGDLVATFYPRWYRNQRETKE